MFSQLVRELRARAQRLRLQAVTSRDSNHYRALVDLAICYEIVADIEADKLAP